jgi:apolipoprotein N-acyltransferase
MGRMESFAGRIILLTHWRRALFAFVAGAIGALTLAPLDFLPAGFIAFTVLVWLLDGALARPGLGRWRAQGPAFWVGWWFGFGYFVAGLWWIGAAVLVDAANFAWALPLAVIGLPAILAIFFGLATALAHMFWRDGLSRIFMLAASFGLFELLRGWAFTGFPWNSLGTMLTSNLWFMQSVAVIGVDGLTLVAVLLFALPALLVEHKARWRGVILPIVILAALAAWGHLRPLYMPVIDSGKTIEARLVQPSIPQNLKWDSAEKQKIFEQLMKLTKDKSEKRPDLILWPETALPYLLQERPQTLADMGDALADGQMILTGAIRVEGETGGGARYYNSVLAINDKGEVAGAADKLHLVPFGEYLPLADWLEPLGVNPLVVAPGAFSPGNAAEQIAGPKGIKIMPLICYEVIFAGPAMRQVKGADLIINVTNDAWYGATPGPYQHFRQAQLRAVENGMPLLRAGNNGLSGLIDPMGNISGGLALDAAAFSDVTVVLAKSNTVYSVHGTVIPLALVVLFALLAMIIAVSGTFWKRKHNY